MMQLIAKTLAGLEPVLQAELAEIGAQEIKPITRGFTFLGDSALMYRANYTLRTALRILVPVYVFNAHNERGLYEGIRQIKWSEYMHVSQTFAVDAVCRSLAFTNSHYVALKTKDAIADQFRDSTNRRPNVNPKAPHLLIHIHIHEEEVSVWLDSSGGSLHKRGYRRDQVEAPLNEVLAAGMVMLTGWNGMVDFFDPMCGSGTLPIEAAMIGYQIPPQFQRESLGFQKWISFDKMLWQKIKAEADGKIEKHIHGQIFAADRDPRARNIAGINMMAAQVGEHIHLQKASFEGAPAPSAAGVMVFNPPYDERMREDDIAASYKQIGDTLKKKYAGWDAWIISSNRQALKHIGLKSEKKYTLYNGALECSFQKFSLWEGPLKTENR